MIGLFCIHFWKCISISSDLINCYLCRILRTEIIKIFIIESKMVNDSKLQQMYLMILFGLSIAQLNFFMTLLLLNQEYLQMQRTRLAIIMKKREIRKKLLLAKTRTARNLVRLKRVELTHGGKTSLQIKFLNQNGRIIFECREKVFTSYVICSGHI